MPESSIRGRLRWISESPLSLYLTVLVLIVLPLVIFSVRTDRHESEQIIRQEMSSSENVTTLASMLIEEHFRQSIVLLESYAKDPEFQGEWQRHAIDTVNRHMELAHSLQSDSSLFSVYGPDGTMRSIAPMDATLIGQSFAYRDWYKGVTKQGKPYVSEVYRTRAAPQTLAVAVAVPIKDTQGKLIGIIAAAYSLDRISQWLSEVPESAGRTIVVVDQRGRMIATPGIDVTAPPADLSSHTAVKKVLAGETGTYEFKQPETSSTGKKNPHGRENYFISYRPISAFGWGVLTYVPSSTVYGRISEMRRQNVIFAVNLLLLAVVGSLLIGYLSKRQQKLKQQLEALSYSEGRYRSLLDNATLGIFRSAQHGFVYANESMAKMLGYDSVAELLALDVEKELFVDPADRRKIREKYEAGAPFVFEEVRFKRKNGSTINLRLSGRSVRSPLTGELEFELLTEDISERRALEAQLRQAQKMDAIGRLAGGVSHDFNNLLTVITGYTDLALESLEAEDPLRSELQEVKNAAQRASTLTRQLLAFSRRQLLEPRVLNLTTVVERIHGMLRRLLGENIQLQYKLDPQLGSVRADPGQMDQVVVNLAVNARDAMQAQGGGRLMIETSNVVIDQAYAREHLNVKTGPHVMLSVSDSGSGMDAETIAQIFEPFFTTKLSEQGTGLGLSTVYGIVQQSGGHIGVESQVGRGTSFKVYLPRVEEEPQRGTSLETATLLRGKETILLVEDEDAVRELTRQILHRAGYNVLTADTASRALELAREPEDKIDLLLTDMILQEMTGSDLAQYVHHLAPQIHVLFMSGYTADSAFIGKVDSHLNLLQKPFTSEQLLRKVRTALDH